MGKSRKNRTKVRGIIYIKRQEKSWILLKMSLNSIGKISFKDLLKYAKITKKKRSKSSRPEMK